MRISFRLIHEDKKSAETACLALSRLAESYKNDKAKLKDIAKAGVLTNLQKILVTGGVGTVSSQTFVTVMHILVVMSSHGSEVGPLLLKENIGPTLRTLLVQEPKIEASTSNSSFTSDTMELTQRNPQVRVVILSYFICIQGIQNVFGTRTLPRNLSSKYQSPN